MTADLSSTSRLALVHALAFATGLVATLIGLVTLHASWLFAAGPCLTLSGVLIVVGSRITFAGPAGDLLRAVLGPARVRGINLRAIVWIVAGILVFVSGFEVLRRERELLPFEEPLVNMLETSDDMSMLP